MTRIPKQSRQRMGGAGDHTESQKEIIHVMLAKTASDVNQ